MLPKAVEDATPSTPTPPSTQTRERENFISEHPLTVEDINSSNASNAQKDAYSVENLTPEQIEDMFEVVEAGAELGYTILDNTESKDGWVNQMHDFIGEQLKEATGYTDAEVSELIEDMWNYPYEVEGVMKTVGE